MSPFHNKLAGVLTDAVLGSSLPEAVVRDLRVRPDGEIRFEVVVDGISVAVSAGEDVMVNWPGCGSTNAESVRRFSALLLLASDLGAAARRLT